MKRYGKVSEKFVKEKYNFLSELKKDEFSRGRRNVVKNLQKIKSRMKFEGKDKSVDEICNRILAEFPEYFSRKSEKYFLTAMNSVVEYCAVSKKGNPFKSFQNVVRRVGYKDAMNLLRQFDFSFYNSELIINVYGIKVPVRNMFTMTAELVNHNIDKLDGFVKDGFAVKDAEYLMEYFPVVSDLMEISFEAIKEFLSTLDRVNIDDKDKVISILFNKDVFKLISNPKNYFKFSQVKNESMRQTLAHELSKIFGFEIEVIERDAKKVTEEEIEEVLDGLEEEAEEVTEEAEEVTEEAEEVVTDEQGGEEEVVTENV